MSDRSLPLRSRLPLSIAGAIVLDVAAPLEAIYRKFIETKGTLETGETQFWLYSKGIDLPSLHGDHFRDGWPARLPTTYGNLDIVRLGLNEDSKISDAACSNFFMKIGDSRLDPEATNGIVENLLISIPPAVR